MVDFSDKIPNGLPKLPDNYWESQNAEKKEKQSFGNIFDNAVKSSLEDITNEISIFKKREL